VSLTEAGVAHASGWTLAVGRGCRIKESPLWRLTTVFFTDVV
jgi:hypothetical protein